MSDNFYRAFEDKHRGSRELIKSRLEIYLPFIEKIKEIQPKPKTIDLGCGRGEWLELLSENDCEAQGIDLDDGMLQACTQRGFDVQRQDALEALRNLDDASIILSFSSEDNGSCSFLNIFISFSFILNGFFIVNHFFLFFRNISI